jgi:hypothetical protein
MTVEKPTIAPESGVTRREDVLYTGEMHARAQERIRRRRQAEDEDLVYRHYVQAVYAGVRRYARDHYWEQQSALTHQKGITERETKAGGA